MDCLHCTADDNDKRCIHTRRQNVMRGAEAAANHQQLLRFAAKLKSAHVKRHVSSLARRQYSTN